MVTAQYIDLIKDLTDPDKKGQFISILESQDIPHKELFDRLVIKHHEAVAEELRRKIRHQKTDIEHIQEVVIALDHLLKDEYPEVITEQCLNENPKSLIELKKVIQQHKAPDEVRVLLYSALYHDIGKAIIRPRHGPEGADVIKESNDVNRKKYYGLGLSRSDIYVVSELTRYHEYLGVVGTGETSYLIFVEVLHPVSNSVLAFEKDFLDYLLLLGLADMIGSIGKIDSIRLNVLMQDFFLMRTAHDNISAAVYFDIKKVRPVQVNANIHKDTIMARDFTDIISELQRLATNSSVEHLRRLIWNALQTAIEDLKRGDYRNNLEEYSNWIKQKYIEEFGNTSTGLQNQKPITEWFIDGDIAPILAGLHCSDQEHDFYTVFSLICKFDYLLSFLGQITKEMLIVEIEKDVQTRKSPHDMRRDIAMCVIKVICALINRYGCLTQNNTRIGLGFERFRDLDPSSKKKLLLRLTGEKGVFKEAEAYTKLKDSINTWIVAPCP